MFKKVKMMTIVAVKKPHMDGNTCYNPNIAHSFQMWQFHPNSMLEGIFFGELIHEKVMKCSILGSRFYNSTFFSLKIVVVYYDGFSLGSQG